MIHVSTSEKNRIGSKNGGMQTKPVKGVHVAVHYSTY